MELAAFRQSQVVVRGGEVEDFRLYGIELRELLALGNHAPDVVLTVSGVELGILRDNLFFDEFVEVHKSSVGFVNLSKIRIPFAKWMVFLTLTMIHPRSHANIRVRLLEAIIQFPIFKI